ncbi:MAG: MBL fold metallo-hydrolase [Clostridiales bacterium]|nr:MBL fold metallo-hydrolase [Clostridiales bacterium]
MLCRITPRCFFMPNDHETDRPCLGYVRGDHYSLMIDAGNSPEHHRLFLGELTAAGLPAPDFIAITHSHWDHTYAMCAAACPTLVNHRTQEHLLRMSGWAWNLPAMEERLRTREDILFCHECILKEYPDLSAIRVVPGDVVYHDRLTLDLGGIHAELLHLENSHADDCSIILIPEEKLVFLGDITCDDLHHDPRCLHQSRYESLRRALTELNFTHAIEGHWEQICSKADVFTGMEETRAEAELLLP